MSFALALQLLPFPAPAEMCITWLNKILCSARQLAVSTSPDKGLIISSHVNDYSYRQVGCHLSLITAFPSHKKKDPSLWHWGEHRAICTGCSTAWQKRPGLWLLWMPPPETHCIGNSFNQPQKHPLCEGLKDRSILGVTLLPSVEYSRVEFGPSFTLICFKSFFVHAYNYCRQIPAFLILRLISLPAISS